MSRASVAVVWLCSLVGVGVSCGAERHGANTPPAPHQVSTLPAATSSGAVPAPAPSAGGPAGSEFWVLAEGWEGTPEHSRSFLHLCPIGDTIAICGEDLVEKAGSFVRDPTDLGSGIFNDSPITGTLPDGVWTTADGSGDDCGKILLSRFMQGSWQVVHKFREAWEFAYRDYRLSPWWPGSVLVMFAPFCCEDDRMVFYTFGDGPKRKLPHPKLRHGRRVMQTPGEMKAFRDGAVVVSGRMKDRSPVVEVWRNPARGSEVTPTPCGVGIAAADSPDDFVLFGETKDGAPCAFRRRGSDWVDLRVPLRPSADSRGTGRVGSYAREPGGTEWVVVFEWGRERGSSVSGLFRRRPAGEWEPVTLPPPRYPPRIGIELSPQEVHAAGDGDVWVTAHYEGEFDRGVILRNHKPSFVCRKERTWTGHDRPRCDPVGAR